MKSPEKQATSYILFLALLSDYCLIAVEEFEDFRCIGTADAWPEHCEGHIISSNRFLSLFIPRYTQVFCNLEVEFPAETSFTSALENHLTYIQ